jgi:heme exporter protein D
MGEQIMGENEKEKTKAAMQLVKDYEGLIQSWSEKEESTRRRIDLTKGVALGLLYGIIGNFFVQFFYPAVEALALGEYPKSFWTNVIVSAISLAVILYMTMEFRSQLKEDKRKMKLATESIRRERNAIEELRKILEKDSPQQKK